MLVAWRRRAELPPDDEIRPWLFGVARRVLANHHRSARRRVALDTRLAAALTPHVAGEASDDGLYDVVLGAMAQLDTDDREILQLVAWEGLSAPELAVVLGCRPAAARKRLQRARSRLRDAMEAAEASHVRRSGHAISSRSTLRPGQQENFDA